MRSFLPLLLGAALFWAPATSASELPSAAAASALGGGHERGEITLMLRGGWPRFSVRAQVGVGRRLAPVVEVEATPSWRVEPALGLGIKLVGSEKGRISAELLGGWHVQQGALPQRGPSGLARIRALVTGRVVGAWLAVGTRHTLLFDRTTLRSSAGTEITWSARHRWSPHLAGGVAFSFHPRVALEVGIDMVFVDVEVVGLSLPGIHASLLLGVPPRVRK